MPGIAKSTAVVQGRARLDRDQPTSGSPARYECTAYLQAKLLAHWADVPPYSAVHRPDLTAQLVCDKHPRRDTR